MTDNEPVRFTVDPTKLGDMAIDATKLVDPPKDGWPMWVEQRCTSLFLAEPGVDDVLMRCSLEAGHAGMHAGRHHRHGVLIWPTAWR